MFTRKHSGSKELWLSLAAAVAAGVAGREMFRGVRKGVHAASKKLRHR